MAATPHYVNAEDDAPHDACGVIGAYLPGSTDSEAAQVAYFGLFALQHRGQESAGIAVGDGRTLRNFTNVGLVSNAFRQEDLDRLPGHVAIGHTRYSTTGSSSAMNAQPLVSKGPDIEIALGHNGNVINAGKLRERLAQWGVVCSTGTDSEVVAHLLAWAPAKTWTERIAYLMQSLEGAYSLVVATKDTLLGIRDPHGVRPLSLGRYPNGGWIIASEKLGARPYSARSSSARSDRGRPSSSTATASPASRPRSAGPGWRTASSNTSTSPGPTRSSTAPLRTAPARAWGRPSLGSTPSDAEPRHPRPGVGQLRRGRLPRASRALPFEFGLMKNRYVGRTFIEPHQIFRDLGVRNKFNPLPEVLAGKRIIMVDDSIVRGTTTPHNRRAAAPRGRHGDSRPRLRSPYRQPVPLRRGYAGQGRVHRQRPHRRGGLPLDRGRLAGLPQRRKPARSRQRQPLGRRLLRRMLHRQLPHAGPAPAGQAGARAHAAAVRRVTLPPLTSERARTPAITDLPGLVAGLDEAARARFDRIYQVSTSTARMRVPETMVPWVEGAFGQVAAVETQQIVRVSNLVTGEGTLFNSLRALRPVTGPAYAPDTLAEELAGDPWAEPREVDARGPVRPPGERARRHRRERRQVRTPPALPRRVQRPQPAGVQPASPSPRTSTWPNGG